MPAPDLIQILEDIAATELDPTSRTVLVVEDDEELRPWVTERLREQGFVVSAVGAGREAVRHIGEKFPRVVVTDKNIPDFSGLEVIRRGKALSPATEFILMTGDATLDSAIEAVNLGALAYVQKPFRSIEELARRVRAGIERQRIAQVNRMLEDRLRVVESELLTTKIELSTMDEVVRSSLRERARVYREFIDTLLSPLSVIEADMSDFAAFAEQATTPENVSPELPAQLGRLKMLEKIVRRLHRDTQEVAERLELEADEARSPIAPYLFEP